MLYIGFILMRKQSCSSTSLRKMLYVEIYTGPTVRRKVGQPAVVIAHSYLLVIDIGYHDDISREAV